MAVTRAGAASSAPEADSFSSSSSSASDSTRCAVFFSAIALASSRVYKQFIQIQRSKHAQTFCSSLNFSAAFNVAEDDGVFFFAAASSSLRFLSSLVESYRNSSGTCARTLPNRTYLLGLCDVGCFAGHTW